MSEATRRPLRRGVKVRMRRSRGGLTAGTIATIVDVYPHAGGFRYLVKANDQEAYIGGRDIERASRSRYRPVDISS